MNNNYDMINVLVDFIAKTSKNMDVIDGGKKKEELINYYTGEIRCIIDDDNDVVIQMPLKDGTDTHLIVVGSADDKQLDEDFIKEYLSPELGIWGYAPETLEFIRAGVIGEDCVGWFYFTGDAWVSAQRMIECWYIRKGWIRE